jgi:hypothetical protein
MKKWDMLFFGPACSLGAYKIRSTSPDEVNILADAIIDEGRHI